MRHDTRIVHFHEVESQSLYIICQICCNHIYSCTKYTEMSDEASTTDVHFCLHMVLFYPFSTTRGRRRGWDQKCFYTEWRRMKGCRRLCTLIRLENCNTIRWLIYERNFNMIYRVFKVSKAIELKASKTQETGEEE